MFAILAGLMALLVVLAATIRSRFDGGNLEKALVGLLAAPMLAFGNVQFSKGWLIGAAGAALMGLVMAAGGLPLLLFVLFLGVALAAFWDREASLPECGEVCVVEEYLDDAGFIRLIELGERGLALQLADWLALGERGNQLCFEDERETAQKRIHELEADNLRLVALLAQAYKPKPAAADLLDANQQIVRALTCFEPQDPQIRAPSAHA